MNGFELTANGFYNDIDDMCVVKALVHAAGKPDIADRIDLGYQWRNDRSVVFGIKNAIYTFISNMNDIENKDMMYEKVDSLVSLSIREDGNTYHVSITYHEEYSDDCSCDDEEEEDNQTYYISTNDGIALIDQLFNDIKGFNREVIAIADYYRELSDDEKDKAYSVFLYKLEDMEHFKEGISSEMKKLNERLVKPFGIETGCPFSIHERISKFDNDGFIGYRIDNMYISHGKCDFITLLSYINNEKNKHKIYNTDLPRVYQYIDGKIKEISKDMEYHLNVKLNELTSRDGFEKLCEDGYFKFLRERDFDIILMGSLTEQEEPNLFTPVAGN